MIHNRSQTYQSSDDKTTSSDDPASLSRPPNPACSLSNGPSRSSRKASCVFGSLLTSRRTSFVFDVFFPSLSSLSSLSHCRVSFRRRNFLSTFPIILRPTTPCVHARQINQRRFYRAIVAGVTMYRDKKEREPRKKKFRSPGTSATSFSVVHRFQRPERKHPPQDCPFPFTENELSSLELARDQRKKKRGKENKTEKSFTFIG